MLCDENDLRIDDTTLILLLSCKQAVYKCYWARSQRLHALISKHTQIIITLVLPKLKDHTVFMFMISKAAFSYPVIYLQNIYIMFFNCDNLLHILCVDGHPEMQQHNTQT